MSASVEASTSRQSTDLNAIAWLKQDQSCAWFAAVSLHSHVDLIPISDSLAAILRDRWPVA